MSAQTDSIIAAANHAKTDMDALIATAASIASYVPAGGGGGSLQWPQAIDCLGSFPSIPGMIDPETYHYAASNVYSARRATNTHDGSVLFYGDSITEAMAVNDITPFGINMGIGGQYLRGLLNGINTGTNDPIHRAGACVVCIGVNDLGSAYYASKQNAADTVVWMWENQFSPAITGKWVIIKILPVDTSLNPSVLNSQIVTVNTYLQNKFSGNTNVRLVDVNATLAPSGVLLPQYHIGDGLHLSAAGYSVLKPAIKAALDSLL